MANIRGTEGPDFLNGTNVRDVIAGLGGDDYALGGLGNDMIDVGDDSDRASGGLGNDWVAGQAGDDALYGDWIRTEDGYDYPPEGGNDQLYGGPGNDWLDGQGGNDRLSGGADNDTLLDILGNNTLIGGDGDDLLVAYNGSNRFLAGAGNDWMYTQASAFDGASRMNGGTGADGFQAYLMASTDPNAGRSSVTIEDFHRGEGDQLHISASAETPLGAFFASGADLFHAFDSNGSGVLGDGDAFAQRAAGGGVVAHWFNTDLVLRGDQTAAADWLS